VVIFDRLGLVQRSFMLLLRSPGLFIPLLRLLTPAVDPGGNLQNALAGPQLSQDSLFDGGVEILEALGVRQLTARCDECKATLRDETLSALLKKYGGTISRKVVLIDRMV
jgi:hypothetical protein